MGVVYPQRQGKSRVVGNQVYNSLFIAVIFLMPLIFLPLVFANAIIMGLMVLIDGQRWTRFLVFPWVFMAVLGGIAALLL